jgi:hypothetical protein
MASTSILSFVCQGLASQEQELLTVRSVLVFLWTCLLEE